jgi:hypothetical protein
MALFEVAIIAQATKEKEEELLIPPTAMLAKDSQTAGFKAIMEHKDKITVDFDRVQVLVRPFG